MNCLIEVDESLTAEERKKNEEVIAAIIKNGTCVDIDGTTTHSVEEIILLYILEAYRPDLVRITCQ